MGDQMDRFRRVWEDYLGQRKSNAQEAMTSLQNALEKTEPAPEETEILVSKLRQDGENDEPTLPGFKPFERIAQVVNLNQRQQIDEEKSREKVVRSLANIKVIAFVGPSGTGKSTRAIEVAKLYHIDYFIDDGLLIHGSRILCGTSAKRAATKMESVRQAIFLDETRAENMRRVLAAHEPEKLMILGTSDAMLEKICTNLHLNLPVEFIRIEDVSTDEEMLLAKQSRMQGGQHTIPVPSLEIKHEFNGSILEPLSRLRRRFERDKDKEREQALLLLSENEKTVVRPTFSSLGSYSISDEAIHAMALLILQDVPGLAEVLDFKLTKEVYGVVLKLEITLYYGFNALQTMAQIQSVLAEKVELYTAINVLSVDVKARRVVLQQAACLLPDMAARQSVHS